MTGLVAFWGGLATAAESYPSEYDWRYMTISSLLYPDRNPHGYLWGRAGLVICGLGGLYWVVRALRADARTRAALAAGYGCMVLCAVLPSPFVGMARSHDMLALAAFLALCVGVSRLTFAVVLKRGEARARMSRQRRGALAVAGLPLLPVVLAAAAVAHGTSAHLPWVTLAWRARGISAYWSFAFWEWVACAMYSALLLCLGSECARETAATTFRGP